MTFKKNSIIKVSSLVFNSISFLTKGMKIKDLIKANLVIGIVVTNLAACNNQNTPTNLNSINPTSNDSQNKNTDVQVHINTDEKGNLLGVIEKESKFNIKANIQNISVNATADMKYPGDHPDPDKRNKSIAAGKTDNKGAFIINTKAIKLTNGEIVILEVSYRILKNGKISGNNIVTLRTILKYDDGKWSSITSPGIYLNNKTSAITACVQEGLISSKDVINAYPYIAGQGVIVKDLSNVPASLVNKVKLLYDDVLADDKDPVGTVVFNKTKNEFYRKDKIELLPKKPLSVTALAVTNISATSAKFYFDKNGNINFNIYLNGNLYKENTTDAMGIIENLNPNTSYQLEITGLKDGIESDKASISFKTSESIVENKPAEIIIFNLKPDKTVINPGQKADVTAEVSVTDPEGKPTSSEIKDENGNVVASVTGSTANFKADAGNHTYTLVVKDSENLESVKDAELEIKENQKPVLLVEVSESTTEIKPGEQAVITVKTSVTDEEADTTSLKVFANNNLVGKGTNVSFNVGAGISNIRVEALDSLSLSSEPYEENVNITEKIDSKPVIGGATISFPGILNPGQVVSRGFSINASDAEGPITDFALYDNNSLVATGQSGNINVSGGFHRYQVIVKDSAGQQTTYEFTKTVDVNTPPNINSFSVTPTSAIIINPKDTAEVTLFVSATDNQGVPNIVWYSNGVEIFRGASGKIRLGAGNNNITVAVRDGLDLESSRSQMVSVRQAGYIYTSDKISTDFTWGTFGNRNDLLTFSLFISGSNGTFIVEKKGSFDNTTTAEIRVGSQDGPVKATTTIFSGSRKEILVDFSLTQEQWDSGKVMYLKLTNSKGVIYSGPITVFKKAQ